MVSNWEEKNEVDKDTSEKRFIGFGNSKSTSTTGFDRDIWHLDLYSSCVWICFVRSTFRFVIKYGYSAAG